MWYHTKTQMPVVPNTTQYTFSDILRNELPMISFGVRTKNSKRKKPHVSTIVVRKKRKFLERNSKMYESGMSGRQISMTMVAKSHG